MANRRFSLINRPANTSSVQDGDIDSESATDGWVLTADGAGGAAWEASSTLSDGTTTDAVLKWDGADWVEDPRIRVSAAGGVRAFHTSTDVYTLIKHTGTHGQVGTQTGDLQMITGTTGAVEIQVGKKLRWLGGIGLDTAEFYHDGTDFLTEFTPVDANSWVVTGKDVFHWTGGSNNWTAIYCQEPTQTGQAVVAAWSGGSTDYRWAEIGAGPDDSWIRYYSTLPTPDAVDFRIFNDYGNALRVTDKLTYNQVEIYTGDVAKNPTRFLISDAAGTDYAEHYHDGTDYVVDFTNTVDWQLNSLTGRVKQDTETLAYLSELNTQTNTFPYKFSTNTDVNSDPGSGYLRFNTAVPDDNFSMSFSAFDTDGVDRTSEWLKYTSSGTRIIIRSTDGTLYYDLKSATAPSSIVSYDWESNHRVEGMVHDTTVPDNDETIWVTIESDQAIPEGTVRTTHDSVKEGAILYWRDSPSADGWWEDNRIRLKPGQYATEIEFHGTAEQFCDITGTSRTMTLNSIASGTSYIKHNADIHQFHGHNTGTIGLEVHGPSNTVEVKSGWTFEAPSFTATGAISGASFAAPGGGISGATGTYTGAVTAASYGGINENDLVDKSAAETISGTWTFSNTIVQDYVAPTKYFQCRTETTTNLADSTHAVNTDAGKVAGAMVFNTTTNTPVWATGSADNSTWVDGTGTTAHTPSP